MSPACAGCSSGLWLPATVRPRAWSQLLSIAAIHSHPGRRLCACLSAPARYFAALAGCVCHLHSDCPGPPSVLDGHLAAGLAAAVRPAVDLPAVDHLVDRPVGHPSGLVDPFDPAGLADPASHPDPVGLAGRSAAGPAADLAAPAGHRESTAPSCVATLPLRGATSPAAIAVGTTAAASVLPVRPIPADGAPTVRVSVAPRQSPSHAARSHRRHPLAGGQFHTDFSPYPVPN